MEGNIGQLKRERQQVIVDERLMWNHEKNLDILIAVQEANRWYRGDKKVAAPEKKLSAICRPGSDGDMEGAHRLMLLSREIFQGYDLQRDSFQKFKASSYQALEALYDVTRITKVKEAKLELKSFFTYLERVHVSKRVDERYAERVNEHLKKYIQLYEQISAQLLQIEVELMGVEPSSPIMREQRNKINDIHSDVKAMRNRGRQRLLCIQALNWIADMWKYYNEHPEQLSGFVSGRRVRARDVWESVSQTAVEKYKIPNFEAFRRGMKSLRQARYRRKVSG